jgi:MurNAc alpha-1-phosphate uridylyltransferase
MLTVAILAGGLATRLMPITKKSPKALVEVHGLPFVDWQLRLLAENGLEKVVFCVGHLSDMIINFVGDGSKYGIKVAYSIDGVVPLGTAGAIKKALPLLGDDFMVLYGDSYLPIDYQEVQEHFYQLSNPALMTVFRNDHDYETSNVAFHRGKVTSYSKSFQSPKFTHIDYGLSVFNWRVFELVDPHHPADLSEICSKLSTEGKLSGFEVFERFYEIGSHRGLDDFKKYIERRKDVL